MKDDYKVLRMTLGYAATNCYFYYRESYDAGDHKHHGIFFDPATDAERIFDVLTKHDCVTDAILLTHAHDDHIGGAERLKELTGAKLYIHEKERRLCEDPALNFSAMVGRNTTIKPDVWFHDDELFEAAGMTLRVIYTPGHTEGSASYYFEESGTLFAGDTLFQQSVGRTDLPTGSMSTLVRSIREKLFVLPDDTKVFPGHMEPTTIGFEKQYNPFL